MRQSVGLPQFDNVLIDEIENIFPIAIFFAASCYCYRYLNDSVSGTTTT